MMLQCEECGQWRLIYAKKKLTCTQKQQLERVLNHVSFSCGTQLQDYSDLLQDMMDMVFARKLNCNEPIERLFYSAKFADICVHCSSESVSPWNDTEEFYPVWKSFREKQDCQYKKLLGKRPLQSIVRNSRTWTIIFRIRIDYTSIYVNVECMDSFEHWSSSRRAEVPQCGMLGAYVWTISLSHHTCSKLALKAFLLVFMGTNISPWLPNSIHTLTCKTVWLRPLQPNSSMIDVWLLWVPTSESYKKGLNFVLEPILITSLEILMGQIGDEKKHKNAHWPQYMQCIFEFEFWFSKTELGGSSYSQPVSRCFPSQGGAACTRRDWKLHSYPLVHRSSSVHNCLTKLDTIIMWKQHKNSMIIAHLFLYT